MRFTVVFWVMTIKDSEEGVIACYSLMKGIWKTHGNPYSGWRGWHFLLTASKRHPSILHKLCESICYTGEEKQLGETDSKTEQHADSEGWWQWCSLIEGVLAPVLRLLFLAVGCRLQKNITRLWRLADGYYLSFIIRILLSNIFLLKLMPFHWFGSISPLTVNLQHLSKFGCFHSFKIHCTTPIVFL